MRESRPRGLGVAAPNPRPSLSLWQGAISGGIGGGLIASLLPEDPSLFVVYLHGFGAGFLASPLLAAVFLLLDRGPPSFRRCKHGTCDAIGGRTKRRVQLETARAAPYLVPDQLPSLRNGRVIKAPASTEAPRPATRRPETDIMPFAAEEHGANGPPPDTGGLSAIAFPQPPPSAPSATEPGASPPSNRPETPPRGRHR